VIKLANTRLDDVRRRTQQATLGHRGHRDDPLYRSCKVLTIGRERLDDKGNAKLENLLEAGDPHGEVRMAWHAKEILRGLYDQPADEAAGNLDDLIESLHEPAMAPELRQLGRTLRTWRTEICTWHRAQVSNGPTEATNNLIKVLKRIGAGSASATTDSESCSTPAAPTGTTSPHSPQSPHPEIRRAAIPPPSPPDDRRCAVQLGSGQGGLAGEAARPPRRGPNEIDRQQIADRDTLIQISRHRDHAPWFRTRCPGCRVIRGRVGGLRQVPLTSGTTTEGWPPHVNPGP
jgi:hypothetical protein